MTQGLVKKTREVHLVNEFTAEMFFDIVQRTSPPARLERLRARVQQHLANELHDHHVDELKRIERHFVAGTAEAVLKLMLASLELKMNLADTDQYVKPVAMGEKHSKEQSDRASNSRPKQITEDMCLSDVVDGIATSTSGREASAKELWPLLFGELDVLGASPQEIDHPLELKKSKIRFTMRNEKRGQLTFGSFEEMVTKAKKSD